MGHIVIENQTGEFPQTLPLVEIGIKKNWADVWQYHPELELVRCSLASASQDVGTCIFTARYGMKKEPWESEFSARTPLIIDEWWVRVDLVSTMTRRTIWCGRVYNPSKDLYGSSPAISGRQTFVAYGPGLMLRRAHLSRSKWKVGDDVKEIGWMPAFNHRSRYRTLIGNRMADKETSTGSYLFGGKSVWSRYDAAEYILENFVKTKVKDDEGNDVVVGPDWRLSGQADLLKNISDPVECGTVTTAEEMLGRLIDRKYGLDYVVLPWCEAEGDVSVDKGFQIHVFSLVGQESTFNGQTILMNPNTVEIDLTGITNIERASISRALEHRYGTIRIIGKRIVVTKTLKGSDGTLEPKWSEALETAYVNGTGTGTDPPSKHDAARKTERFASVYQRFGLPASSGIPAPKIDALGNLVENQMSEDYQKVVRETLNWLPMFAGYDYSTEPPTNENKSEVEDGLETPMAWVKDPDTDRYVPADAAGFGISVLHSDWGVAICGRINHYLAKGHFTGETLVEPKYDYSEAVATIAVETDQRLMVEYAIPGGGAEVMEIEDSECELWVITKGTVIGVKNDGTLLTATKDIVARNNVDMLSFKMAGAIVRYCYERNRAEIPMRGLFHWGGDLVGMVLTAVAEGDDVNGVMAPITGVDWSISPTGAASTTIKTGFAQ